MNLINESCQYWHFQSLFIRVFIYMTRKQEKTKKTSAKLITELFDVVYRVNDLAKFRPAGRATCGMQTTRTRSIFLTFHSVAIKKNCRSRAL